MNSSSCSTNTVGSDLARRVALALEPEPGPVPEDAWEKYMAGAANYSPGQCWEIICDYNKGDAETWGPHPFDSDRNLLPLILAEVERCGKIREFIDALDDQLPWGQEIDDRKKIWLCLNASMSQICAAFLAAVGGD